MFEKLPKISSERPKTNKSFDLPVDYTISKFYELGYKVSYSKYSNVYNSCCPLCKEGKSWGRKKRCFFVPENDNIYCHNCGESLSPYSWVRKVSGMSDKELWKDVETNCTTVEVKFERDVVAKKHEPLPKDSINLFNRNQIAYYANDNVIQAALKYIKDRRLDSAKNKPDALYISKNDFHHKNRLIIPFKNSNGKIIFYQTRKLFEWDDRPPYLSKFDSDKSIFGIERVDPNIDEVFVFEGPIDSCFVKNGVAVAGISEGHHRFTSTQVDQLDELRLFKKIWVLDSQWIDKTAREKTQVLLDQGECVFLWPKKWGKFKDFNEICMRYEIDEISPKFITENALCGKEGILKSKILFSRM